MPKIPFDQYSHYLLPTHDLPKTQGDLRKKIWILIPASHRNPDNISLLKKILKAIHLDLRTDACLIYIENRDFLLRSILPEGQSKIILSFGLSPKSLGLNLSGKLYHQHRLSSWVFFFSEGLTSISSNQEAKKQLWTALQDLFPKSTSNG